MAHLARKRPGVGRLTIAVIGTRGFPGVQGGVESHCAHLYPLMTDTTVRVYRRKPYLNERSATTYPNIEFIDLPSTRIKGFEAVFHTLLCVLHIALHRPDVVHVHNFGPGFVMPLLKLLGLRTVLTYHSTNYEHDKWGSVAKRLLRWCESLAMRWSDRVIFVNRFVMQRQPQWAQEKSIYIPNGIDPVTRSADTSLITDIGINPGQYILAVGRLSPEKGLDYLVQACDRLPQATQVVIAGASDHDDSYARLMRSHDIAGKVVFTGYAEGETLRQLYSHARLYVLPSLSEGFPIALLEAMSYGLPIVASDIPATRLIDLPEDHYARPGDADSLATVIADALSREEHPSYDLTPYSWEKITDATLSTLKDLKI